MEWRPYVCGCRCHRPIPVTDADRESGPPSRDDKVAAATACDVCASLNESPFIPPQPPEPFRFCADDGEGPE